ncbi:hypothetical protein H4S14_004298 [Agrobacterium vitis]|nr:hypothetical protein [Agrobacterium vitis]MBE1440518.1 hypothetical protein [Agrobacterium vitis]
MPNILGLKFKRRSLLPAGLPQLFVKYDKAVVAGSIFFRAAGIDHREQIWKGLITGRFSDLCRFCVG